MTIYLNDNSNGTTTIRVYDKIGQISDGYHTFDELYKHRILLFIALMKSHTDLSWWSYKHADGTQWDGWIIGGMHLPSGDISYHMDAVYADLLDGIQRLEKAPEWDGHTSNDVLLRLNALICSGTGKNAPNYGGDTDKL
jgi:hypothetical protein